MNSKVNKYKSYLKWKVHMLKNNKEVSKLTNENKNLILEIEELKRENIFLKSSNAVNKENEKLWLENSYLDKRIKEITKIKNEEIDFCNIEWYYMKEILEEKESTIKLYERQINELKNQIEIENKTIKDKNEALSEEFCTIKNENDLMSSKIMELKNIILDLRMETKRNNSKALISIKKHQVPLDNEALFAILQDYHEMKMLNENNKENINNSQNIYALYDESIKENKILKAKLYQTELSKIYLASKTN